MTHPLLERLSATALDHMLCSASCPSGFTKLVWLNNSSAGGWIPKWAELQVRHVALGTLLCMLMATWMFNWCCCPWSVRSIHLSIFLNISFPYHFAMVFSWYSLHCFHDALCVSRPWKQLRRNYLKQLEQKLVDVQKQSPHLLPIRVRRVVLFLHNLHVNYWPCA